MEANAFQFLYGTVFLAIVGVLVLLTLAYGGGLAWVKVLIGVGLLAFSAWFGVQYQRARGVRRRRCSLEAVDAGAAIEDLRLAFDDRGVTRQGLRREVARRGLLGLEVMVPVRPAAQQRAVPLTGHLADRRRDVADGEADPTVIGPVGRRAVEHQHVMERHLARPEQDVDRPPLVHLDGDLLTAREQVARGEGVAVRDLRAMRAWHHAHRAVLHGGVRERHPRRDDVGLAEAPVGRVLVPGHVRRIPRLLDEEARAPAEEVRPQDGFDGVEDDG